MSHAVNTSSLGRAFVKMFSRNSAQLLQAACTRRRALIDLAVFIDAFVILPACYASCSRSRADSLLFFYFLHCLDRPVVPRLGALVAFTPHITTRICCSVACSRALSPPHLIGRRGVWRVYTYTRHGSHCRPAFTLYLAA